MSISSYHHISEPKSASQFWPKSLGKNRNRFFYPSTKNHRELIFWTSGVIFRDEFHGNAQKFTAPPNRHFTCFETTFETLQNLQTAENSRGQLRFRRFFDENDRNDPNFFFQNFRVAEIFASTKNLLDENFRSCVCLTIIQHTRCPCEKVPLLSCRL